MILLYTSNEDPVIWHEETQISADTIYASLQENEIDKLFLQKNCFIMSVDTLGNFNQVKGRLSIAYFQNNQIDHISIDGKCTDYIFPY